MANNKISKYFKRLDTNQILTSDADFLSMPLNTKIARDTGEEYIKRYGNVFDKTQKSFITSESADGVFAKLKEDNTFTANNTFEKGVKLGQEPTLLEHATTKKYVDGKIKEANDEITNIINGTNQTDSNIAYINKNNKFQGTQNFTNVAIKGTATSKTPIATSNDTTIPTTAWVNAKQATTKQKGLVQLINSYTSTSQTLAPTANALKMVYDMLGNYITKDEFEESGGAGSVKEIGRRESPGVYTLYGVKIGVPIFIANLPKEGVTRKTSFQVNPLSGCFSNKNNPITIGDNFSTAVFIPNSSTVIFQFSDTCGDDDYALIFQ